MTKKEKCELWKKKLSEYYAGLKPIAKDLEEQKQEIKLEDVFNDEKRQGVKELIDKHKQETLEKYSERFDNDKSEIGNPDTWGKRVKQETLEEASWKHNPLKKLDGEFLRHAFIEGAKWQQEQIGKSEFLQRLRGTLSDAEARRLIFEQFKNK